MVSVEKLQLPVGLIDSPLPSLARFTGRKKVKSHLPIPPPVDPHEIPWRGHGGRQPTVSSVEFDRQLDKISVWLEDWSHEQRCLIVEGVLRRSNYNQFQFLSTSLQPMLHRDFMYTAQSQFPAIDFVPVSTHTSRKLKEKLIFTRQDDFHRIPSAHYQHEQEVKEQIRLKQQLKLPGITNQDGTPLTDITDPSIIKVPIPRKKSRRIQHQTHSKASLVRWMGDGSNPVFASLPHIRSKSEPTKYKKQQKTSDYDQEIPQTNPGYSEEEIQNRHPLAARIKSKYIDQPVRRHIQDENTLQMGALTKEVSFAGSCQSTARSLQSDSMQFAKKKKKEKSQTNIEKKPVLPDNAVLLYSWYSELWSDVKRNEFLHKFLLKLDPRQHYFVSSLLTARQYKDFIALLPEHIALKILSYLTVKELLRSCMVSKTWNRLASNNDIWKTQCGRVKLDVPVGDDPNWKQLYKENVFLRVNWSEGFCSTVDLKGHMDSVTAVTLDETRLASGSIDKTIRIWDIKTGTQTQMMKGHSRGVWSLNFFTQNLLISGSYDGTIRVWNLRTGKCSKTILAHEGPVWALVRYNDTLVSASQDKTAKVWDIGKCLLLNTLTGHAAAVFAVDMNENGSLVVTGSADKSVRIWDPITGACKRWISVNNAWAIMSVSYSQGHVACSYGEMICLYKVEGPTRLLKKNNEHKKRIECLKLNITDRKTGEGSIVSAGKDGLIKYWDTQKENSSHTFVGHRGDTIQAVHFDELRIASAAHDNKIRIWDFNISKA